MQKSFLFTDLQLLQSIQRLYSGDYWASRNNQQKLYIPIDCDLVARDIATDGEMVFQRLYSHLNKKYAYTQNDGSQVYFFALSIGEQRHCINYPYLCSILAHQMDEKRELSSTKRIAIASLIISLLSACFQLKGFLD